MKNVYCKEGISIKAKLRYYRTVIRSRASYAECPSMSRRGLRKILETKERKIVRKIVGPVKVNFEHKRWHKQKLNA